MLGTFSATPGARGSPKEAVGRVLAGNKGWGGMLNGSPWPQSECDMCIMGVHMREEVS